MVDLTNPTHARDIETLILRLIEYSFLLMVRFKIDGTGASPIKKKKKKSHLNYLNHLCNIKEPFTLAAIATRRHRRIRFKVSLENRKLYDCFNTPPLSPQTVCQV